MQSMTKCFTWNIWKKYFMEWIWDASWQRCISDFFCFTESSFIMFWQSKKRSARMRPDACGICLLKQNVFGAQSVTSVSDYSVHSSLAKIHLQFLPAIRINDGELWKNQKSERRMMHRISFRWNIGWRFEKNAIMYNK